MNSKSNTSPAWVKLLILLGLVVVACVGLRTISTSEVWMHLASGRWMAENGMPDKDPFSFTRDNSQWVNPTWLYDRILYLAWRAGDGAAVTGLHVALVVGAFILLLPCARKWAGPVAAGLGLLLSAWLLGPRFDVRPAAAGLFFTAFFVFMLNRASKPWVLLSVLVPAQILWTNLHDSFLIGPVVCLVFAIQAAAEDRGLGDPAAGPPTLLSRRALFMLLLAGVTLVVTLFNPYGFGLYRQVIGSWTNPAYAMAQEWVSPFGDHFLISSPKYAVYVALLVAAAGLVTLRRKLPVVLTTLAIVSAFLVVRSLRFTDVFAVLAFPFFCLSLASLGDFLTAKLGSLLSAGASALRSAMALLAVLLGVLFLAALVTNSYHTSLGSASRFGLGVEYGLFPEAAMTMIQHDDFPERALNLIPDGGYLAWRAPARKVFVDQRAGLYGSNFYTTLADGLLRGEPESLNALIEQWKPGAVILNATARNAGLALRNLLMGGRWTLAYFDGATAILLQPVSTHAELINNADLHTAGLQVLQKEMQDYRRRGGVVRPGVSARLVGGGSVFLALSRYEEAAAIYSLLTQGAPNMAAGWLSLGICQTQLGHAQEAVKTLRRACEFLPRNALAWLWLSRAYAEAGSHDEARQAFERGKQISAATAEAFGDPLKKN
ncbi:MAG: tetratricopeptide repeat protein [Kiritimatiellae bacterium]|nr:tetratricopeptide repeat protein [Kiritimatiellia bacterium]